MALQPLERQLPVARSPYSFFQPTWEVGPWQDFNTNFRQMQMQMKQMEKQMEEMFRRFQRLHPSGPMMQGGGKGMMPAVPGGGQVQEWRLPNPIIEFPDGSRQFQLQFDVRQFRPEEVAVRTYDNLLVVHARHKETSPNSKMHREFTRQFLLPQGVRPDVLKSTLNPEGVLVIEAPLPALQGPPQERLIPIEQK